MKILCVGDVFANPGREILARRLPSLVKELAADFVIVNGENAADGRGITKEIVDEFNQLPIDVITSGNHIWQHKKNIASYLNEHKLLRPHNAPKDRPGNGVIICEAKNGKKIAVINLQGRVHMYEGERYGCPFEQSKKIINDIRAETNIIVLDLHAEITSEKKAMGFWLDGDVSIVYGTHTHVQTADETILPNGTAYITDIGMTGSQLSVIGARAEDAIRRFLTKGEDKAWKPAEGREQLQGICVDINNETGRANKIVRVQVS